MNKKIQMIIAILVVSLTVWFGIKSFMPEKEVGSKTLSIKVVDELEDKVLYEKEIKTDAETLGQLLDEREDLNAEFEDMGGRLLTTLLDVKAAEDNSTFWLYNSTNNKSCVEAGFCTGVDELPIYDGDEFTFKFTDKW